MVNNTSLKVPNLNISQLTGIEDRRFSQLLYLERYFNEGTQNYSQFSQINEVDETFKPKSQTKSFKVPTYKVPIAEVQIVLGNPTKEILDRYVKDGFVRFCVHPTILSNIKVPKIQELVSLEESSLTVTPTSSTRTVFVIDNDNVAHCVKLHLPLRISRFQRDVDFEVVQHCVTVSQDLENIINFKDFAFFRETIGMTLTTQDKKKDWGFLIREMRPFPPLSETRTLIPFFSLYGTDMNDPKQPPLLVRLVSKSQMRPKRYVVKHILYPVVDSFLKAFTQRGILLELHSQNTVLELDENFTPSRIVYRDLDDSIDASVRKRLGLSMEGFQLEQIIPEPNDDEPKGSTHSLIYDKSIGRLNFDYLAQTMRTHFGIAPRKLQKKSQARFKNLLPEHQEYFPETVFKYADKPKKPDAASFSYHYALVDTAEPPVWRPVSLAFKARLLSKLVAENLACIKEQSK